ncbi:MAG: transcriptional repressor [Candidatus Competibacterales bacterium]|nr:transcriptional repressor [Candidatus Competibacterales bacterium]
MDYRDLLEQAGILPTRQRLDIARVMLGRPQHLSADQLMTLVNANGSSVSKATIYNTLSLFARKGVVREVVVDASRTFYDSNVAPHHHLYHEDHGTLTDIHAGCVEPSALPELPEGTELSGVDVVVRVRSRRP